MNRSDFIKVCTDKTGLSKDKVKQVLDAAGECILENIATEEEIIPFVGVKFKRVYRSERRCRNPQTGESMVAPAKYVPAVKFGANFKQAVNK